MSQSQTTPGGNKSHSAARSFSTSSTGPGSDKKAGKKSAPTKHCCGTCKKEVTDDCMECVICVKWYHAKCTKISKESLKLIESTSELHWYCVDCDKQNSRRFESYFRELLSGTEGRFSEFIDRNVAKASLHVDKVAVKSKNFLADLEQGSSIMEQSKRVMDGLEHADATMKISYADVTKNRGNFS